MFTLEESAHLGLMLRVTAVIAAIAMIAGCYAGVHHLMHIHRHPIAIHHT